MKLFLGLTILTTVVVALFRRRRTPARDHAAEIQWAANEARRSWGRKWTVGAVGDVSARREKVYA